MSDTAQHPLDAPVPSPDPLAPAIRAMDRGDFAEARRLAGPLSRDTDTALATRAKALLDQLAPDPVVTAVLAASGVLIAILAALYVGN